MKARKGRNWLYVHHVIDADLYYVGQTCQQNKRFINSHYKQMALYPYLDPDIPFSQNKNIETFVLPVSDREFALRLEDMLILKYRAQGKCINKHRSGLVKVTDKKAYDAALYQANRDEIRKRHQAYNETHYDEMKQYFAEYRKSHKDEIHAKYMLQRDERIQYAKNKRSTPEGKIYGRVNAFNRYHPDRAIETPLEAKQKYLEWGYIPDYIKSDDLI